MKKEPSGLETQYLLMKFLFWQKVTNELIEGLEQSGDKKIGLELIKGVKGFSKSMILKLEEWGLIIPEDGKV